MRGSSGSSSTTVNLLDWYYDEGFVPGSTVDVRSVHDPSGAMAVTVDGVERSVGEAAADGLFVRPH